MGNKKLTEQIESSSENRSTNKLSRKQFLKISGISAAAVAGLSSCTANPSGPGLGFPELNLGPDPRPDDNKIWLGSGDVGILNFVYVYLSLEAAFYNLVLEQPYTAMTEKEMAILTDIQKHEIARRDFFNALLGDNAIRELNFNFSDFNFNNRKEILRAAFRFENIGVSICNNAGELFLRTELFLTVAKIASVEARHASAIQFLMNPTGNFVDYNLINENGLDVVNRPKPAYSLFSRYIVENLDIEDLA